MVVKDAPVAAQPSLRHGPGKAGARILVVEDDKALARLVYRKLRRLNFSVDSATTARDARSAYDRRQPDLILLDLDLADATAWEFLSDARLRKCTPVLTLSMLRSQRHAVAALESGADDYIIKPFGLDELVAQQADTISHIVPGVNARELHVTAFRSSLSVPRYPSGSGPNR